MVAPLLTHWSCCGLVLGHRWMCAYNIFYLCSALAAHTNMYLFIWTIARLRPSAWRYMLNMCDKLLFAMWYYGCLSSLKDPFTRTHCPDALDSLCVMDNELYIYIYIYIHVIKALSILISHRVLTIYINTVGYNRGVVSPNCINTLSPSRDVGAATLGEHLSKLRLSLRGRKA